MRKASGTAAARRTPAASKAEPAIGELLRQLRTERDLSVRTLASRAGFSPSFLSQVELNQASPSIASLDRLATALGVTLGDFFRGPAAGGPAITRAGKRRPLTSWWSRARIEPLTPMGPGQPFEALMVTIAAGGSSGKRPHATPGHHFAIVFDGELRLTLGGEVHVLGGGDGVTLGADAPHRWENVRRKPAQLVLVSSRFPR
jgi:transcriptional regulator with XRE-family HTH domain